MHSSFTSGPLFATFLAAVILTGGGGGFGGTTDDFAFVCGFAAGFNTTVERAGRFRTGRPSITFSSSSLELVYT